MKVKLGYNYKSSVEIERKRKLEYDIKSLWRTHASNEGYL